MVSMGPFPRNDEDFYHVQERAETDRLNGGPSGSIASQQGRFPVLPISPERLHEARSMLEHATLGVLCEAVLASIIKSPWIFGNAFSSKQPQ